MRQLSWSTAQDNRATPRRSPNSAYGRTWRKCRSSFHLLDALDHVGVFGTVFVPHRLHGILEGFLVGGRHLRDGDPGRRRLLHRLLLINIPKLALFLLGFFGVF